MNTQDYDTFLACFLSFEESKKKERFIFVCLKPNWKNKDKILFLTNKIR